MACGEPAIDLPDRAPAWHLSLEPEAELDQAPLHFRARIASASELSRPWLVRGELSAYHGRALQRGELPSALQGRAVPLRYWRAGPDLLLQPLVWLEPGTLYSLVALGEGQVVSLQTSTEPQPRSTRLFPAAGRPKRSVAVLCGLSSEAASGAEVELALQPGSSSLEMQSGIFGSPQADCITLRAGSDISEPLVTSPAVAGVLLDPAPFEPPGPGRETSSAEQRCQRGMALAGGCLELQDDRAFVTAGSEDALWLLDEPEHVVLSLAPFERAQLLTRLEPASALLLMGQVFTAGGARAPVSSRFATSPRRRHLVLSEVLANSAGPEPQAEWIEIANDAAVPASLGGLWLEDGAGSVALPDRELAPHALALLVGPGFGATGLDVPPAPGTELIELPSLGVRGLSNSGEPLMLVGADGIVSRFPALAAPHAGHSLARVRLDAPDDLAASFAEHGGSGASPGGPNTFD